MTSYNTMDEEELETPPSNPKDCIPSPLPSVTVESEEKQIEENNSYCSYGSYSCNYVYSYSYYLLTYIFLFIFLYYFGVFTEINFIKLI